MTTLTEKYNIIHVNNEWYFDTINELHLHINGIDSYIKSFS